LAIIPKSAIFQKGLSRVKILFTKDCLEVM
jgi:hypothetical protein